MIGATRWCWKSYNFTLEGRPHKEILVVLEVLIEISLVKQEENISALVQAERMDETLTALALLSCFPIQGLG